MSENNYNLGFFYQNQQYNDCSYPFWSYYSYPHFPFYYNQNFYQQCLTRKEHLSTSNNEKKESNINFPLIQNNQKREQINKPQLSPRIRRGNRQDGNYFNKYQKEDRNLNSIVIRNFVNFVNSHPQISKNVDLIIQNRKLTITASQYLELFKKKLPPKQSYIGVGKMKSFIEIGKQNCSIKLITLILLRKFIQTDYFTVLINSKKVSRSAKEKEFRHGKKFWKFFVRECLLNLQ